MCLYSGTEWYGFRVLNATLAILGPVVGSDIYGYGLPCYGSTKSGAGDEEGLMRSGGLPLLLLYISSPMPNECQ